MACCDYCRFSFLFYTSFLCYRFSSQYGRIPSFLQFIFLLYIHSLANVGCSYNSGSCYALRMQDYQPYLVKRYFDYFELILEVGYTGARAFRSAQMNRDARDWCRCDAAVGSWKERGWLWGGCCYSELHFSQRRPCSMFDVIKKEAVRYAIATMWPPFEILIRPFGSSFEEIWLPSRICMTGLLRWELGELAMDMDFKKRMWSSSSCFFFDWRNVEGFVLLFQGSNEFYDICSERWTSHQCCRIFSLLSPLRLVHYPSVISDNKVRAFSCWHLPLHTIAVWLSCVS